MLLGVRRFTFRDFIVRRIVSCNYFSKVMDKSHVAEPLSVQMSLFKVLMLMNITAALTNRCKESHYRQSKTVLGHRFWVRNVLHLPASPR